MRLPIRYLIQLMLRWTLRLLMRSLILCLYQLRTFRLLTTLRLMLLQHHLTYQPMLLSRHLLPPLWRPPLMLRPSLRWMSLLPLRLPIRLHFRPMPRAMLRLPLLWMCRLTNQLRMLSQRVRTKYSAACCFPHRE